MCQERRWFLTELDWVSLAQEASRVVGGERAHKPAHELGSTPRLGAETASELVCSQRDIEASYARRAASQPLVGSQREEPLA